MKDPWNYSLYDKPEIITQLNIEFEQYFTKIFIHPPVFIYASTFLYQFLNIPLVAVPLICQTVVMLCISIQFYIIGCSLSPSTLHLDWKISSLWAVLIFCLCPVSVLISQKFWIDNMLLVTVYGCITFQLLSSLWLCRLQTNSEVLNSDEKENLMRSLSEGEFVSVHVFKSVVKVLLFSELWYVRL